MTRTLRAALLFSVLLGPGNPAYAADPAAAQTPQTLLLELRVFNGTEEVTNQTRVFVHRAGDRGTPVAEAGGGPSRIELRVQEGIYDVQAVREREGQVVNIQWANRLVVMAYPDEAGRHLEVLNFRTGFGALQIRTADGSTPAVSIHEPGATGKEAAAVVPGAGYSLFVVPAGIYELAVKRGEKPAVRHADIEVPRDRTRLWVVPSDRQLSTR
jgi:hypothetical protein